MKEETKCYCGHTTYCDCGPEQDKMRNIYILSTDNKLSRLYFNVNDKEFQICEIEKTSTILKPNRHIYITSDEEVKEGDWVYGLFNGGVIIRSNFSVPINNQYYKEYGLKIILTTDQDLINNGVQAIDDEFLEWFIQNPSCEEVEVVDDWNSPRIDAYEYKIIIPKDKIIERFIANAKQEISYSEEEVENICGELCSYFIGGDTFDLKEWFEQFKNK